jgi:lipopolysaccharide/colanic/teichoic acid biosynthesis glycosyltransferase
MPEPYRHQTLSSALTVAATFLAFGVLPVIYYWLITQRGGIGWHAPTLWMHLYLNAAANWLVMIVAARSEGRLDHRINAVISSFVMAHGALAFGTLVFRLFYSNEIMLVAASVSLLLSAFFLLLRHRVHRNKAALFGPFDPVIDQLQVDFDYIAEPNTDLRSYDLILTTQVEPPPGWSTSIAQAMMAGKPVRHVAEYLEEEQGVVSIEHFHMDHLPSGGLTTYQTGKRAFDITLVILSAPFAAILLLLGAIAVLISMGRPILFAQPRVGLGGRTFTIYKLRTMRPVRPGEAQSATAQGDLRIGLVGRVLRKFRIDELPQLFNVLRGDMSIIGPRPEWTLTHDRCVELLPAYAFRQLVRPGISGWAQVKSGYAVELEEVRKKLSYDLFYLKNFSFSLDLQILFRTVTTVLTGKGAR